MWAQLQSVPVKYVKGARTYAPNKIQRKEQRIRKLDKMTKQEENKIKREDVIQTQRRKKLITLKKLKEVSN